MHEATGTSMVGDEHGLSPPPPPLLPSRIGAPASSTATGSTSSSRPMTASALAARPPSCSARWPRTGGTSSAGCGVWSRTWSLSSTRRCCRRARSTRNGGVAPAAHRAPRWSALRDELERGRRDTTTKSFTSSCAAMGCAGSRSSRITRRPTPTARRCAAATLRAAPRRATLARPRRHTRRHSRRRRPPPSAVGRDAARMREQLRSVARGDARTASGGASARQEALATVDVMQRKEGVAQCERLRTVVQMIRENVRTWAEDYPDVTTARRRAVDDSMVDYSGAAAAGGDGER